MDQEKTLGQSTEARNSRRQGLQSLAGQVGYVPSQSFLDNLEEFKDESWAFQILKKSKAPIGPGAGLGNRLER